MGGGKLGRINLGASTCHCLAHVTLVLWVYLTDDLFSKKFQQTDSKNMIHECQHENAEMEMLRIEQESL